MNARFRLVTIKANRRLGSVYVMALGAAMFVTVAGVSAVLVLRVNRRANEMTADFADARFVAQSAVELGDLDMRSDANWRRNKPNGMWRSNQPLGRGALYLSVIDPLDGNLEDDTSEDVLLTGIGLVGTARYKLSVEFEPKDPPGMDCLESAVHTNVLLSVNSTVNVDAPISSNGTVQVGLTGILNGNAEAVAAVVVLGVHNGAATNGIEAKETPAATVFDYYIAQALPLAVSALPLNLTRREIRNVVISPGSNPYGGLTHPQGLYLLDCAGTPIVIKNSRIHGTLVILDPGVGSSIQGNVLWERYNAQLPALLVRGSIDFAWSGSLTESNAPATNFNPAGSPYSGVTDTDTTDTYPGKIKGLIFVSSVLTISNIETIDGVVVTAGLSLGINQKLTVTHDPSIILAPPPGFERSKRTMGPVAGSWRQIVD